MGLESGISNALQHEWPEIDIKKCIFHFSKRLIKKVGDLSMKSYYNHINHPEVSDFIRVSLGLPRYPLDRLQEAVELLKIEGKKLPTLKERKFATKYIKYLERTWTSEKCRFKPESWNFFKYKGLASTNNHNEE